jgi:hypothetical protein
MSFNHGIQAHQGREGALAALKSLQGFEPDATNNSRMDKLSTASRAHTELSMMDGTMSSYTKMILRGEQPQAQAAVGDADNDGNDDNSP